MFDETMELRVFDVYQLKKLPQYRTIVPEGSPFPAEGQPKNWRKVQTVAESQLWPEAAGEIAQEIAQKGYFCCLYQPKLTFKEIELAGPTPRKSTIKRKSKRR